MESDRIARELVAHREAIHRYIRGIVRDDGVAEDLTQETFLRAHEKRATLHDPDRLAAWLYRIATNLCHDRFRRSSVRVRSLPLEGDGDAGSGDHEAPPLADSGPRLDKLLEQKEMGACVQRYLAVLPDSYRAVILLHDAAGMTNPEIADMLGVSLATVKIRLHRAREKLRGALRDACVLGTDERGVLVCEPRPCTPRD